MRSALRHRAFGPIAFPFERARCGGPSCKLLQQAESSSEQPLSKPPTPTAQLRPIAGRIRICSDWPVDCPVLGKSRGKQTSKFSTQKRSCVRISTEGKSCFDARGMHRRVALMPPAALSDAFLQRIAHRQGDVAASSIRAATSAGCDTIRACEPFSTATVFRECARSAMKRIAAAGILRSPEP